MSETKLPGKIAGSLFCLPFLGFGVFMGVMLVKGLLLSSQMQSWPTATATIAKCDLHKQRTSDGTSHDLRLSYTYEYGGVIYQGETAACSLVMAANDGSAHRQIQKRRSGPHIICYVNPEQPAEAALLRDPTAGGILFPLIFVVVFGGLSLLFLWAIWRKPSPKTASDLGPKPWLKRKDWQGPVLQSNLGQGSGAVMFMALAWNAISWPIVVMLPWQEELARNKAVLAVLLFPAVGLGLLAAAAYKELRNIKYGSTRLELREFPGALGCRLEGIICSSRKIVGAREFKIKLENVRRVVTGSGKHRHVSEHSLWEDELILDSQSDRGRGVTELPVFFRIPPEAKPSDLEPSHNTVSWRLTVSAETPGIDYKATFAVPVFEIPERITKESEGSVAAESPHARHRDEGDMIRSSKIIVQKRAGGFRVLFPAARFVWANITVTLLMLVFGGFAVGIGYSDAPPIFILAFGGVAVILLIATINMWIGKAAIEITRETLILRKSGCFGTKTVTAPLVALENVAASLGCTVGGKQFYRLTFRFGDATASTVCGTMIPGRAEADAIVGIIGKAVEELQA